jgi:hypothetical protein
MSKVVRSVKNVTKGYSSVQVKVRNGTFGSFLLEIRSQENIAAGVALTVASCRCDLTGLAATDDHVMGR